MDKVIFFLFVLLAPLSLSAMSPLTDSDLSDFSNPLSLGMIPGQGMTSGSGADGWGFSGVITRYLLGSGGGEENAPAAFAGDGGAEEGPEEGGLSSVFSGLLGGNGGRSGGVDIFIIDKVTGKDITAAASAEDTHEAYNPGTFRGASSWSMPYPSGSRNSSEGPYRYIITSGFTEMRDTYINQTNSTISPGGWVDIKPR